MSTPDVHTADEKTVLHNALVQHRAAVRWKVEGLDEIHVRRPLVDSGTNLLGLVKHLGGAEYGWFCVTFGRPREPMPFDWEVDPESDMRAEADESTADILAFYGRACAAADAAIAEIDLDATGVGWSGRTVSMRWVLVHMIAETARHAGHMDILRELVDGTTGDQRRS